MTRTVFLKTNSSITKPRKRAVKATFGDDVMNGLFRHESNIRAENHTRHGCWIRSDLKVINVNVRTERSHRSVITSLMERDNTQLISLVTAPASLVL
ncbi:hypothetical protein RRG08_050312 [Elysia crispata]|uniref:Uncharacterized protein n=1 Tax=Elysia crispata TaxID=231223 RepID=A0AAE0ZYB2_9GAST|nr:hypothetical protein RRG08_050312 [Elysia crispata]